MHTPAPTSRRMGLGAGAAFRLPPLRDAEAPARLPEEDGAVRFPPVDFFCVDAM
ncbi:hypothetical protein CE91St42_27700 [Oscillospiraceae bacterium]|nr:hypothetical protein CE91St42_27700 [Oscillospiraceae bacterium]